MKINEHVSDLIKKFTSDDMAALLRFVECCEDPDAGGHDVEKSTITRLSQYGALRQVRPGYHEVTEFGEFILNGGIDELQQYRAAAEPARNPVLGYADSYRDMAKRGVESVPIWSVITDLERNIAPLFAAPQVTSVPEPITRNDAEGGWWMYKGRRVGGGCAEWYNRALDDYRAMLAAPAVQAESILRDFYSAYDEWINSGAPEGSPFARGVGLCANLFDYVASTVLEDLHAQFVAAGLDEKLPFNASESEFVAESGRGECYINPARVAWVRARIAAPAVQAEQQPVTDAEHVASVLEMIGSFEPDDIDSDSVDLRFELDGLDTGSDVSITEYATRGAAIIRQLSGNTEQVGQPALPEGYALVPSKLTAENGTKGLLSGEFSETKYINCPECFGDDECETCDGSGRIEITVPVSWTTIKEIWAKGVEHFAAAPQQEAQEVKK